MKKLFLLFVMTSCMFSFDLKTLKESIKADKIEAKFIQTKNIKNFSFPFKSTGEFKIIRQNELFWSVKTPIKSEIKITSDGIFTLNENKWQKSDDNIDKSMFLDLLSLNIEGIKKVFDIDLSGDTKAWEIKLNPKNFIFKKIFNHILIKGDQNIKSFDINETNGDFTHIDFVDIKVEKP